jgi:uncharacterized protein
VEPAAIAGAIGALGMGVSLGVFGAGGSILAVPLLLYAFGFTAEAATLYSLLVVGITSAAGFGLSREKVPFTMLAWFLFPSMGGMYAARAFLLPLIPDTIPILGGIQKSTFVLSFFSLFMLAAAVAMIFPLGAKREGAAAGVGIFALAGSLVGLITGIAGAGGGFMIVPALVLLAGLPFATAARSSLAVIAINSIWGFAVSPPAAATPSFTLIFGLIALALIGMFLGLKGRSRLPAERLKPAFGIFILMLGSYMLWRA